MISVLALMSMGIMVWLFLGYVGVEDSWYACQSDDTKMEVNIRSSGFDNKRWVITLMRFIRAISGLLTIASLVALLIAGMVVGPDGFSYVYIVAPVVLVISVAVCILTLFLLVPFEP